MGRRRVWGWELMADMVPHTHTHTHTQRDSLRQLRLYLLPDFLPLLVAAHREDVAVLQLPLAGPVPKLHGQQLLPHPTREGACRGGAPD